MQIVRCVTRGGTSNRAYVMLALFTVTLQETQRRVMESHAYNFFSFLKHMRKGAWLLSGKRDSRRALPPALDVRYITCCLI